MWPFGSFSVVAIDVTEEGLHIPFVAIHGCQLAHQQRNQTPRSNSREGTKPRGCAFREKRCCEKDEVQISWSWGFITLAVFYCLDHAYLLSSRERTSALLLYDMLLGMYAYSFSKVRPSIRHEDVLQASSHTRYEEMQS